MTTPDDVRARLEADGHGVTQTGQADKAQLSSDRLDAVVNVWPNGTCSVQGRQKVEMEAVLGELVGKAKGRGRGRPAATPAGGTVATAPAADKKVFVVYGHDTNAKTQADAMLRRWGLVPLILDQLPSHGNTIIEKLEHYQEGIGWAVVLLTPDDIGHPALDPTKASPRPRQNVVLEMGMLLSKLGRERVAMIYKKSDPPMELPSDIHGYIYIPFVDNVEEAGQKLAKEMDDAGFHSVPARDM